ncbi:MAG: class I SAM-dependent methyltransferase [Verrucomicrobiota bacterium]
MGQGDEEKKEDVEGMTISDDQLESSWVVANRNMNRERQLSGPNSYEKDLQFSITDYFRDPAKSKWLDLCCGSGRALIQLATDFGSKVECHGVDLIDGFPPTPPEANVTFYESSLHTWDCDIGFDLITCVHGLHYIGDKLGVLQKIGRWLNSDGRFLGHLDLVNISHRAHKNFGPVLGKRFKQAGIQYDSRKRIISFEGDIPVKFNYRYIGADDTAGPNYTGQDAVKSVYDD